MNFPFGKYKIVESKKEDRFMVHRRNIVGKILWLNPQPEDFLYSTTFYFSNILYVVLSTRNSVRRFNELQISCCSFGSFSI